MLRYLPRILLSLAVAVVVAVVLAPPMLLATLFTSSGRPGQLAGYMWSWAVAKSVGITASATGTENVNVGQSYVVTPNHQGNADVLAIELALPIKVLWVIKKELTRIPFFGWALARSGAICLDRSKPGEALAELLEGAGKLRGGWSLLIYPEGTRSPGVQPQPFKAGAFRLAIAAGIPILPVTINGAHRIWPKKTLKFRPGHMTLTIGKPITTSDMTEDDVPLLKEKTLSAILENLIPDYDPFERKVFEARATRRG